MRFGYKKIAISLLTLTAFTTFAASGMTQDAKTGCVLPATASEATVSEALEGTQTEIRKISLPDGFYEESGRRYYRENGNAVQDAFIVSGGELYHAGPDGTLDHGWYQEDGDWYYFDETGKAVTGWVLDGSTWYYLEGTAYLCGWNQLPLGESLRWFCFSPEGALYQDCVTPDGYPVDEDGIYQETQPKAYDGEGFVWDKERQDGSMSGLVVAGQPAEFYMLSMAGETSGGGNLDAVRNGDRGCAYGLCQFDYRYDLIGFMNFAYGAHPKLWPGFKEFLGYPDGDPRLKGNSSIGDAFLSAMAADYETAVLDQLSYIKKIYWNPFYHQMNQAGYRLDARSIAVSAAFLSVNVNCGPQASLYIKNLSPQMTDEELIRGIYRIRNTTLADQKVGNVRKGTTKRYLEAEPQMALDLLYGYVTIDSVTDYGGGVEWHGNPFVSEITTQARLGHAAYKAPTMPLAEDDVIATPSEAELDAPEENQLSEI